MLPYRKLVTGLVGVVAVFLWIGGASADEPTVLRGGMFIDVMSGNTISGTTPEGVRFHVYILNGGVATFVDENERMDVGRWYVRQSDDAICIRWKQIQDEERCAVVTRDGNTLNLDGDTPIGEVKLDGTIVTGFD